MKNQELLEKKFVVFAFDTNKNSTVTVSEELTEEKAEAMVNSLNAQMDIAIDKYKNLTDIRKIQVGVIKNSDIPQEASSYSPLKQLELYGKITLQDFYVKENVNPNMILPTQEANPTQEAQKVTFSDLLTTLDELTKKVLSTELAFSPEVIKAVKLVIEAKSQISK